MTVARLRRLLPLLTLALVVGVIVAPIFFDQSLWLRDNLRYNHPEKLLLRERLLQGELPLWNSLAGLGRPLLALVQPAILYPGTLLVLLPRPFGVDLYFCVHLLIAALGMRAWLRATGLPEVESTIGGALFGASGYLVAMVAGNGAYATGVAWIPWALWAAARPRDTRRAQLRAGGLVGVMLALAVLAGDPQAIFIGVGLCGIQALAQTDRRRAATVVAIGVVLATGIALPQLLAGWEAQSVARPGGVSITEAGHFALHPRRLVELLWPGVFGRPHSSASFISPLYDEGTGVAWEPWASGIYLGLLTPALAIYAVARRCRERLDVALAIAAGVALLLALGPHTPIWPGFFRVAPGASLFRYPEKYLLPFSLCACALAARGLPTLVRLAARALRFVVPLAALLLGLAGIATRSGAALARLWVDRLPITPDAAGATIAAAMQRSAGVAIVVCLLLWAGARGRLSPGRLTLLLGGLWITELVVASLPLMRFVPAEIYRATPPVVRDLAALVGERPAAPPRLYRSLDAGVLAHGGDDPLLARLTLLPSSGQEDGVAHTEPYTIFHTPYEDTLQTTLRGSPVRLLQLTATRFALLADRQLGPTPPPGLTVQRRYPNLGAVLVEVEAPSARIYLARETRPAADIASAAGALLAPDFVPGATAVVEGGPARRAAGSCALTRHTPEVVIARCTSDAPTYAVLADLWFPGWSATVDGEPTPIARANAAMRAVAIDSGTHEVVFRYRPRGLSLALGFALVTLLLALGLALRR